MWILRKNSGLLIKTENRTEDGSRTGSRNRGRNRGGFLTLNQEPRTEPEPKNRNRLAIDLVDYNSKVLELLTSDPPAMAFDVTYQVLDPEGKFEGEVSGHKFLLARPVFRRGFYGTDFRDKKTESIEMKGTTLKAFKAMIGVIYRQPLDIENMTVVETFELMNLAERYDLPKLKTKLKEVFEAMNLSKDSVVEVANTAMKFHQLEEASRVLLENCAKTLYKELDTKDCVVKLISSVYGTKDETMVLKLISMMKDLPPLSLCSNCQESPCKSGTAITSAGQIRPGTVVAPNTLTRAQYTSWDILLRGVATVKMTT